ncbi:MAG TPA: guanylate kinase [Rhabdochlamydiaceae bacterium]|nr:guanylate kinase [Rhabdochlamydiaceae bacterium]
MSKILGNCPQGLIFVVSAPAGTGKTTLVDKLMHEFPSIVRSVSCTTRAPRSGEKEGKDYFFLDKKSFEDKIQKGQFLEYAKVFGEYYGTSGEFIKKTQAEGKHVVLVIDTQGALTLQKQFQGKAAPIFIFITPPSLAELKERLNKRQTENPQSMEERLAWAKHELEMVHHYDYHIVNDDLATAYAVLKSIFIAEEHRIRR